LRFLFSQDILFMLLSGDRIGNRPRLRRSH